jgi:hypothetical protein
MNGIFVVFGREATMEIDVWGFGLVNLVGKVERGGEVGGEGKKDA